MIKTRKLNTHSHEMMQTALNRISLLCVTQSALTRKCLLIEFNPDLTSPNQFSSLWRTTIWLIGQGFFFALCRMNYQTNTLILIAIEYNTLQYHSFIKNIEVVSLGNIVLCCDLYRDIDVLCRHIFFYKIVKEGFNDHITLKLWILTNCKI